MGFALGAQAAAAGYRLEAFESVGSTNAEAVTRIRAGEQGPLWLVTGHQTAGRGRRNRAWMAPPGNLAATILEVIDIAPAQAATLGFAAGVAMAEALRSFGVAAELKWPNDVMLGGAKLSGILLEAEQTGDKLAVIVGTGVNVVAAPPGLPYAVASLADAGHAISAERLFTVFSDQWADTRALWDKGRGMPALRKRWLAHAAGIGKPLTVQIGERRIAGTFDTLDESGHLIVVTDEGKRMPIASGEVFFGEAATRTGAI
jgi:BirA family biotin operon repressor/biotin-[acetyl-CoA-carboxylase] ligase